MYNIVNKTGIIFIGLAPMNDMVLCELNIIRTLDMKPNFSELSKKYGFDRKTIKKYYEQYKDKVKNEIKKSILDEFNIIALN